MERAKAEPIIAGLIQLKQLDGKPIRAQPFGAIHTPKRGHSYLGWPSSYRLVGIPFGNEADVLRVLVAVHTPPLETGDRARHEHHVIMGILHPDYSGRGVGDEPPPFYAILGRQLGNTIRRAVAHADLDDALLNAQTRLLRRRSYHVLDYAGHSEETDRLGRHQELLHTLNHGRAEAKLTGLIHTRPTNTPANPSARLTSWHSFRLAFHEVPGIRNLVPVLVGVYLHNGRPNEFSYQPLGILARSEKDLEPGKAWPTSRCPFFHPFANEEAEKRFTRLYKGANYWGFQQYFGKKSGL